MQCILFENFSFQRTEHIVRVLICLPLAEDTIIVKCARLIVQLLDKNLINISVEVFRSALRYSIQFIHEHKFVGICDALRLMQALIKNHLKNDNISIGDESSELFQLTELLIRLINDPDAMQKSTSCHYDGYSVIEIKSSAVFCLEAILSVYEKLPEISECLEASMTKALLQLIYSVRLDEISERIYCNLMRSAFNSCRFIGFSNREWCTENVGDLLGACVSNMLFGLPEYVYQPPQRIQSSQQTVQDTHNVSGSAKKGGKLVKNRKPRQTPQFKNRKSPKTNESAAEKDDFGDPLEQTCLFENPGEKFEISHFTTSDSDASDPENARSGNKNREKETKLRLAAISLIAIVAKVTSFLKDYWLSVLIAFLISYFSFTECRKAHILWLLALFVPNGRVNTVHNGITELCVTRCEPTLPNYSTSSNIDHFIWNQIIPGSGRNHGQTSDQFYAIFHFVRESCSHFIHHFNPSSQ